MPSVGRGIGCESRLNELGGACSRLVGDPVEFFQCRSGTDLPALEAFAEVAQRVLVIPQALPESLNLHQDSRVRSDTFEGVRDVIKDVQVFDDRADLGLPHVVPAGREAKKVARISDRGIRVRQAFHPCKDLIPRAARRLAQRREETR